MHLRWFIVDDSLRGSGIGRQLLSHAMRFVEQRLNRLSAKKCGDDTA
nr:GNAT family N-acetyltransferase [Paraburkholderia sp. HP33-1]